MQRLKNLQRLPTNKGDTMILETIADANRVRYEEIEKQVPFEVIKQKALSMETDNEFPYVQIAKDYENAGASAISVLTEPKWFKGENAFLEEISKNVSIPLLRKDFTVCEYQIYEAKTIGASAVLLICSLLDTDTIRRWIKLCDSLGLSALVEAHTADEVYSAIAAGARVIGVNNRNLRDFTVDINNCTKLRKLVPDNIIFVAESGIKTRDDIKVLENAGVNAVLIGETLMRNPDKKAALDELSGRK